MIEWIVIEKKSNGQFSALGAHKFAASPRVGEYVAMTDEEDNGQVYCVRAVIHPLDPAVSAGDLIIEYVDTELRVRKKL